MNRPYFLLMPPCGLHPTRGYKIRAYATPLLPFLGGDSRESCVPERKRMG